MPHLRHRHVQDTRKGKVKEGDRYIDSKLIAHRINSVADTKKAEDVVVLDMRRASDLCDYFFICSAASTRQAKAIADGIIEELHKKKLRPWHVEGYREGYWIVVDYNSVIAHIFYNETRAFYRLERLWGDAPRVTFAKTTKKAQCRKTSLKKAFPAS